MKSMITKYLNKWNGKVVEAIKYTTLIPNNFEKCLKFSEGLAVYKQKLTIDTEHGMRGKIDVLVYKNGVDWIIIPDGSYIVKYLANDGVFKVLSEEEFLENYMPYEDDTLEIKYDDINDELLLKFNRETRKTHLKDYNGYSLILDVNTDKIVGVIVYNFIERARKDSTDKIVERLLFE